jgi:hypothetical protein
MKAPDLRRERKRDWPNYELLALVFEKVPDGAL